MRFSIILLLLLLLVSCATPAPVIVKGKIPEIKPPQKVEIEEPGKAKDPNTTYLSPPLELKPNQYWRAYQDGALVWKNKDLRGIKYGLKEWPRWGQAVQDVIKNHNESIDASVRSSTRPWYKFWK